MRDLIERVEKATGPDRELDIAIFEAAHPKGTLTGSGWLWTRREIAPAGLVWYWLDRKKLTQPDFVENYTASIDAALALVEKVLPGWRRQFFERSDGSGWTARLISPTRDMVSTDELKACPSAPLAILLALLRSIQKQDNEDA